MRFPSEIVVDHFIPTVRYMLARELQAYGLTEKEIAMDLGVSQAAVSKYRQGKVKLSKNFLKDDAVIATVKGVAKGLAEGTMGKFEALAEFMLLVQRFENRGKICELHEKEMPELVGLGCDLCVRPEISELKEEQEIVSNLRRAISILENTEGFSRLIPNVGSNIAMAKRGAKDLLDVAAVPGRIYEMRGQTKVPAPPEFGASKHVSEVVLAVKALDDEIRSGINIAFRDEILKACATLGFVAQEMDAKYEGRKERIQESITAREAIPRVIFHRGGFGIEPITYVLGRDAVEAATTVIRILRTLEGSAEQKPRQDG